jgi:hypothetical protein
MLQRKLPRVICKNLQNLPLALHPFPLYD